LYTGPSNIPTHDPDEFVPYLSCADRRIIDVNREQTPSFDGAYIIDFDTIVYTMRRRRRRTVATRRFRCRRIILRVGRISLKMNYKYRRVLRVLASSLYTCICTFGR